MVAKVEAINKKLNIGKEVVAHLTKLSSNQCDKSCKSNKQQLNSSPSTDKQSKNNNNNSNNDEDNDDEFNKDDKNIIDYALESVKKITNKWFELQL